MGELFSNEKKDIERFVDEYTQLSSKDKYTKDDIDNMKNLLKMIYYHKVICAMEEGENYPGSEYMDMSYMRGSGANQRRNPNTGRYMASGGYPMYDDRGYGRRYYDDKKNHAIRRLESMMDNESDPEMRMAMQEVLKVYENR